MSGAGHYSAFRDIVVGGSIRLVIRLYHGLDIGVLFSFLLSFPPDLYFFGLYQIALPRIASQG